ncbi:Major Facilitator Superfamily protein [Nocardioides terrae]|uniref:Major Facilitator Superfamily protein n=1 Tax=Nocardioides terrae TaxID=574651 RepID=A0A1I1HDH5_9ACTN|nr:MFS transporter [Nocardioides terrae]SFC21901.1 Major Facilitator Superfamily protein [Nocardioides terrae]
MPSPLPVPGFLARLVPPTPLSRQLALQSMLFSTGEGTFNTGSAVFLTQVVGMSAPKAGLALTIAGLAQFVFAYPAGRVVDRFGPKRMWATAAVGQAAGFLALPFVHGFGQYVVVALFVGLFDCLGENARHAYTLDVFEPKERVETQAYMYSSLNVGFTLGALLGGAALAFDSTEVIRWTPLVAVAMMLLNSTFISRLPAAPHDLRVASGEARVAPTTPSGWRNPGWIATTFFTGTMWTNQALLNVVIPLWLVEATDAPRVLLAWLFGTNTVLCIFLPAYTSRGVKDLRGAMRFVWISTGFFVGSCLITMLTHETVGWLTIFLVWLGHVTVTGAELAISGASWMFQSDLMDPQRRGEYQGVSSVFQALGGRWAPALYTWLAISVGDIGWLVIGAIAVVAALGLSRSTVVAERFARQHFPADPAVPADPADPAPPVANVEAPPVAGTQPTALS